MTIIIIIMIIMVIIIIIIMVDVLSNLQFNFHHKLPLESLSKFIKIIKEPAVILVWKLWTVYARMFAVTAILACVIKICGLFKSTKW